MAVESLNDLPGWEEFEQEARRHRRSPVRLIAEFMRECVESWEGQKLDADIRRSLRGSAYRPEDAVEIVREYRQEKRKRGAAP